MIGKISGRLDYRAPDHVLIDTGGVGYIVHCSERTLAAMPPPIHAGRLRRCFEWTGPSLFSDTIRPGNGPVHQYERWPDPSIGALRQASSIQIDLSQSLSTFAACLYGFISGRTSAARPCRVIIVLNMQMQPALRR